MIRRTLITGFMAAVLSTGGLFAADPHSGHHEMGHGNDPVLPGGSYAAKVKAMVCEACPPQVEKTLKGVSGIKSVSVDQKAGEVCFAVKDGASVKWSSIQSALKASSDKMGMGADFTLSEFRIGDQEAASTPDQTLKSGYYSAKVGAIVCGGCKDLIEKTMRDVDGVGAAQVDSNSGTVKFAVLQGKSVPLSKLQSSLKEAANQMGMGADYTLSEVKSLKKV